MTPHAAVILAICLLASCAAYRPLVDLQGRSQYAYESDLADCQNYARTVSVGTAGLVGAGIGAGLGAALGAVLGDAGTGAALGAIAGGAQGLAGGGASQVAVIQRCLSGRGYVVLR